MTNVIQLPKEISREIEATSISAEDLAELFLKYGNQVREECAKVCDSLDELYGAESGAFADCAEAIRKNIK